MHALQMEKKSGGMARGFSRQGREKSIILEAIAYRSLHIWYVFFDTPGSNNDLNVLDRLRLVHNMLTNEAWDMHFVVNSLEYNRYYLLADGIYHPWSCFVQTIHLPSDEKRPILLNTRKLS
jgi:hypothetical protein